MTEIQIIRSRSGEEMVVIAKSDYDALVAAAAGYDEDDDDAAIYDARKAELATEGFMPVEVSHSMLSGDSRIKALRKHRKMSQMQLAEAAGITQGFLSELEGRSRNLTDAVADALASALDVPAAWLKG